MNAIDPKLAEKLRARLGRPPTEPSGNLSPPMNHEQPAPVAPPPEPRQEPVQRREVAPVAKAEVAPRPAPRSRRDIRSISATGRLVQFSSRVTVELDDRIRDIIERRQSEINAARRGPKYKYGICNFLEEAAFLFENIPTAEE